MGVLCTVLKLKRNQEINDRTSRKRKRNLVYTFQFGTLAIQALRCIWCALSFMKLVFLLLECFLGDHNQGLTRTSKEKETLSEQYELGSCILGITDAIIGAKPKPLGENSFLSLDISLLGYSPHQIRLLDFFMQTLVQSWHTPNTCRMNE